jgi:hypothetical protein
MMKHTTTTNKLCYFGSLALQATSTSMLDISDDDKCKLMIAVDNQAWLRQQSHGHVKCPMLCSLLVTLDRSCAL